jgi:TolB-like protein/Tfp pilus assembly protein PilF
VPRRGYRFAGEVRNIENIHRNGEIIIERHAVSQTLIEEISPTENEELKTENEKPVLENIKIVVKEEKTHSPQFSILSSKAFALAAGLLLVLTGGFAVWRYQNSRTKTSLSETKSIAVLPLKSFASKNEDEELRLRITDALITKLGNLSEISVRPTSSVLRFAREESDTIEAGKKLEVDAVLDGRIQTEGERLRVTLQLVSVRTGEQIWSEQFDGKTNEILNLQDKISVQLLPRLTPSATLAKNPTANPEAYENYLKGRYLWNKRQASEMKKAIPYFEQAIALEPNFAPAYAGLADAYSMLTNHEAFPTFEGYAKAKEMAQKALAIDPNFSEGYSALGWILYEHEWNWAEAEKAFARAIELNPNNVEAHHWRGLNFHTIGKTEEYFAEMEKARSLAPLTKPIAQNYYGVVRQKEGCEKAFEYLEKFIALYQFSEEGRIEASGYHYAECGDYDKAIVMLETIPHEKLDSKGQTELAVAYAKTGRRKEALEILERLKKHGSTMRFYLMPYIHVALGDFDTAFADLEKGIEARDDRFTRLKHDDFLAPLRSDARFKQLLKKMNLSE